jgi:hypothetical protein
MARIITGRSEMKIVTATAALAPVLAAVLALSACSNNAADTTVTDTAVTSVDTAGGAGMAPNNSGANSGATGTGATAGSSDAMAPKGGPNPTATHDTGIISQGSRDRESAGETIKDAGEDAAEAVGDAASAVAGKR